MTLRTILYATDFSECAACAGELAAALAQQSQARLLILNVKQARGPLVSIGRSVVSLQPAEHDRLRDIAQMLQRLFPGLDAEPCLAHGTPAAEILHLSQDRNCDLIVMGSHGRTGLDRLLQGSVAERVQRQATCPVVAVSVPRVASRHVPKPYPERSAIESGNVRLDNASSMSIG